MPRSRALHERIGEAMDGKRKLGKPEPDPEADKSKVSVKQLVASWSSAQQEAVYDELVRVMGSTEDEDDEGD